MNYVRIAHQLVTLGPIGYVTYAPGTVATICTLPLVIMLNMINSELLYSFILAMSIIIAYYAIEKVLFLFNYNTDPSAIVVDEYIGCLVTFFAVPITIPSLIVGCMLFRFFDISKWFWLDRLEKYPGASGILLDDIGAGIVSNIIIHIVVALIT